MPTLEQLGYTPSLAEAMAPYAAGGLIPARVVVEHRGAYMMLWGEGELTGELAGRLRHVATDRAELPAVGDWVAVAVRPEEARATIQAVLPRRTAFVRKVAGRTTEAQVLAANVDVVLVVCALLPEVKPRGIERYLTLAWESGATPVVVLTKADLCEDVPAALALVEPAAVGAPIHVLSSLTGDGCDALLAYATGNKTLAFLGASGAGKSTLINRLLGAEVQATGEVREADGKGRHTTTHRELIPLSTGGLLLDTPGMRELQLWDVDGGLESAFVDIAQLATGCRFTDCGHGEEPGCAVRAAAEGGTLDPERLASFQKLRSELAYLARRQDARAQQEQKAHDKSATRALRAHLRTKRGGN